MEQVQSQRAELTLSARPPEALAPTPPAVSKDEEAAAYARTFEAIDGVEYGWIQPYALRMYEETTKVADFLDGKAEKLAVFTTAAASILVAAIVGATARGGWLPALCALPSLVLALRTISGALKAQEPTTQARLPEIKDALMYAEHCETEKKAIPAFAAKLHWTSVRQHSVNERKAELIRKAHQTLQKALWWLLVPAVVGTVTTAWPHLWPLLLALIRR